VPILRHIPVVEAENTFDGILLILIHRENYVNIKTHVQIILQLLVTLAIVAVFVPGAFADSEEEQKEAAAGADASNPTAAVNFQDLRYRYFDLKGDAGKHSFETEGAYVFHPRFKITNELRGVRTDRSGDWETDFEILKLKGIFLTDIMPFGIKAKLALGVEWLKDLGDFKDGTGSGSDQIAPLAGIGWIPTDLDFIITLVQYFHSYDTHDGGPKVRKTGPRLIYIRKIPQIGGWFKADYKGEIDHEDDEDYSSILEFQFGKMFTPRIGAYVEGFIGDDVLSTDAYNKGVGIGLRFMY